MRETYNIKIKVRRTFDCSFRTDFDRYTMERWIGKVALVTGASSGIGEAICRTFVDAGLNVLGLARREDKLKELSTSLKGSKGSFHYARCDVRNENDILNAFAQAKNKLGSVDVLVNNAGIAANEFIADSTTETFRAILEVNTLAAAICTREVMKYIRKHKNEGHIFYINSVLGRNATLTKAPLNLYAASKFALRGMTETVKQEIAKNKDQIRVTAIHPGLVKTELVNTAGLNSKMYNVSPYLECEHIAECIVFALGMPPIVQLEEITIAPLHQKL